MSEGLGIKIRGHLIDDALTLLKQEEVKAHNNKIIDAVKEIPAEETIILGQFSMARAADEIKVNMPDRLVLNTPDAAVIELKELLLD